MERRGLPTARWPDDRDELAVRHFEGDVVDRDDTPAVELLSEGVERDGCHSLRSTDERT